MSYDEMDLSVEEEVGCDAEHLIPHSKGDEVRFVAR